MIRLEKATQGKGYFIVVEDALGKDKFLINSQLAVTNEELLDLLKILKEKESISALGSVHDVSVVPSDHATADASVEVDMKVLKTPDGDELWETKPKRVSSDKLLWVRCVITCMYCASLTLVE